LLKEANNTDDEEGKALKPMKKCRTGTAGVFLTMEEHR